MGRNGRNGRNRQRIQAQRNNLKDKRLIKILSFLSIGLVIILAIVAVYVSISNYDKAKEQSEIASKELAEELSHENNTDDANVSAEEDRANSDATFTIAAVGNIFCNSAQAKDAYSKESKSYDFSYLFDDINVYTKTADIAIGNLATTFKDAMNAEGSTNQLAYTLKKIGFDVINTASTHSLDDDFDRPFKYY